jgi:hypothetical protein
LIQSPEMAFEKPPFYKAGGRQPGGTGCLPLVTFLFTFSVHYGRISQAVTDKASESS